MNIIIWSKDACPLCDQAKNLLQSKSIKFEERKIGSGYTKEDLLKDVPTAKALPQIIINGELIGGLTHLKTYLKKEENAH